LEANVTTDAETHWAGKGKLARLRVCDLVAALWQRLSQLRSTLLMVLMVLLLLCPDGHRAALHAQIASASELDGLPELQGNTVTEDAMRPWSSALSPDVGIALRKSGGKLAVVLRVAEWNASGATPSVQLGVAASGEVRVTDKQSQVRRDARGAWFTFLIETSQIVKQPSDWQRLRIGASIAWPDGPGGVPRQIERFGVRGMGSPHAGLGSNDQWSGVRLEDHQVGSASNARISLSVEQPMTGKWTVVIDDSAGRRIRTLVAGARVELGKQNIEWDGLDDYGRLVTPGTFTWRSVHHPGIVPEYVMSFLNGDEPGLAPKLSNHGRFVASCSNAQYAFLASPITEGGCSLLAIDRDGKVQMTYVQAQGTGYQGVAVAADEQYLYVAHDGKLRRERVNKIGQWAVDNFISLSRYEISTGTLKPYSKAQFEQIEVYEHGPGGDNVNTQSRASLAGMTLRQGVLYLSSRASQELLKIDAKTGRVVGRLPLSEPGAVTSDGAKILAVQGRTVVAIDPETGAAQARIASPNLNPLALTIDQAQRVYVADGSTHTISQFTIDGKPTGLTLGQPGGAYQGKYTPERMVNPVGLSAFSGRLWVTEDRVNPKRVLAWDLDTKKVVVQKFGNPPYGGPAGGVDPLDPSRWIGLGCLWELNFQTRSATCLSILQKDAGHLGGLIPLLQSYRYVREKGRTFVVGSGKATIISELMPDGTLKDIALISGMHSLMYAANWQRIPAICDPFEKANPTAKLADKYSKPEHRNVAVMWIDRNGDGTIQPAEVEFGPLGTALGNTGWGSIYHDLSMRMPMYQPSGSFSIVTLPLRGFLPGGAPDYPSLAEGIAGAVPLQTGSAPPKSFSTLQSSAATDRAGTTMVMSDPFMVGIGTDGQLRWQYPNRWSNVHGSHKAPLPSIGQMQGTLSFLGIAPLDESSDVVVINGNHGRFFVMSTDGMYLDEMFRDVRMGGPGDAMHVGGEPFGGSFAYSPKDRTYYLQTGTDGMRVYRLRGLDKLVRRSGSFTVSETTLVTLADRTRERMSKAGGARRVEARRLQQPVKIDGKCDDWSFAPNVAWDRDGQFPVAVRCGYDANNLYLSYEVRDDSPWINSGRDWTTLFKTGDSIDLQLGADPKAALGRREPAVGDVRLLIAPMQGKPLAVLYRHKIGSNQGNPVTFKSPWRSVTVDSVDRLPEAQIVVDTQASGYTVEVSVPLRLLGIEPNKGPILADFGVLYSDEPGQITSLRSYWSNSGTGLVNDIPGEVMLSPDAWGTLGFGE
jgi:hypothetical protein